MKFRHEAALFAVGGLIGLLVDAGVVQLLVSAFHWNVYLARVLSFLLAATATWWWNRQRTFATRSSGRSLLGEWLHWMALMGFGAVVNYGVFVLCLMLFPSWHSWPAAGAAVGSAMAAGVNFLSARMMLFKSPKSSR
jgi:putative flippase GtrA